MLLSQLMEHWPWVLAYMVVSTAIFLWLRKHSSTDGQAAASNHVGKGFGPPMTLGEVAREFFGFMCARLLTLVVVGMAGLRIWWGEWSWWDLAVVAGMWPSGRCRNG